MHGGPSLVVERSGAIATLRLNRPDRLNAVSHAVYSALTESLETMAEDAEVRAIIVTGTGRAFCAGADLVAHGEDDPGPEVRRAYVEAGQRANRLLQTIRKPVVAAVNGHAIGAGIELALSCDLIVVAREAKLRLPELALGTFVGGGTTYTLPHRVGATKARELILLGDFFSGEEALAIGLANRAVPASEVVEVAGQLATELGKCAPRSFAHAKRLLDQARQADPDAMLAAEADALLDCMGTRGWREGIDAFHDKRDPDFTGE